jgi:hypothetical protein
MRRTEWLNRHQASNFMAAHRFAEVAGRPLNLALTLNLSHTTCDPSRASAAFERLRDNHFTRWLRYQSQKARKAGRPGYGPPTYTWVIEAKDGYPHVHWNLHIHPSLRKPLLKKTEAWLERAAGEIEKPFGAIHSTPITNTRGLARYCMKGIDPHQAKARHIRPEYQGTVTGKRCGVSESLGLSARRAFRAATMAA